MMPSWLGTTELIIVLVIVLLIFGAGRIGKIAREFGEGIKSFREGISGGAEPENLKKE